MPAGRKTSTQTQNSNPDLVVNQGMKIAIIANNKYVDKLYMNNIESNPINCLASLILAWQVVTICGTVVSPDCV